MMIKTLLLLVGLAEIIAGKSCPGGYSDGTQVDVGRYWYECRNGKMEQKGCISETGGRIPVGSDFNTRDARMRCIVGSDGFLTATYSGCFHKGSGRDIGSQWNDGTAVFTCVKDGDSVRVVTLGCVDSGRPTKLDERVSKGDYVYQCKRLQDGKPKMNKVGCVYNGREYDFGQKFDGTGKHWYSCTETGKEVAGCMYNGQRYEDRDRVEKDDGMFSCKMDGANTDFEPFACLQNDNGVKIDRQINCFWTEYNGSEGYEYTCKKSGSKLLKVRTQCAYHTPSDGYFKVAPGCTQVAGTTAVACDDGGGTLHMRTFSAKGATSTC